MRILGIDYGLVKIGLALGEEGGLVEPLGVLKKNKKIFEKIFQICQENNVKKIVIGLPFGPISGRVEKFAHRLREKIKLPVEFCDETLTSKQAIVKMIEIGKKKEKRRKREDAFAAALILQKFLEGKEK